MDNVQDLSQESSPKIPRKRRVKVEPTEAELLASIDADKKRLRDLRTRNRNNAIQRLGTLALDAQLSQYDDTTLKTEFAAIVKRLGIVILTVCALQGCIGIPGLTDRVTTDELPAIVSEDGTQLCKTKRTKIEQCMKENSGCFAIKTQLATTCEPVAKQ
jgi:hypothetical protein